MIHWTKIEPADAAELALPLVGVDGPANEMGESCPWPWEPQQLVGVPLGQYHCGYCGAMVLAGVPHLDYRELTDAGRFPAQPGGPHDR